MRRVRNAALLLVGALCACAHRPAVPPDDTPTVKSLEGRSVEVMPDQRVPGSEERTIAAYQEFLKAARTDPQRPEAMRRLGDLQMDRADEQVGGSEPPQAATQDYRGAIALYLEFLKNYPTDPRNDRVLYQLARAYEQLGDLESSLKRLDQLIRDHPYTKYRDEAQFRRGEMLFATRDYEQAERAYATVLRGVADNPYYERSLYMQGWAIYKQGRLADSLNSFFAVLDRKLAGRDVSAALDAMPGLTRADRELVEDTFRVTSLCLENLDGAESIPPYMTSIVRREYEFRVYQQLADLYMKQDRAKDAADTLTAFARREPAHAQAPFLQARAIQIDEQAGFINLALQAKREFVDQYGVHGSFHQANPAAWERAQPLVKSDLTELALHYHAVAQKSRKHEDYLEAVRWYREELEAFPSDPQSAQNNFLLAELLFEDQQFAAASVEYEKAAYRYPHHAKSADAGYAALLAYAEQEKRAAPGEVAAVQSAGVDSALRFAQSFADDARVGAVLTHAAQTLYAQHDAARARTVAERVVALNPPAGPAQRRIGWTVIGHACFDLGDFASAEHAYGEVLALMPDPDAGRGEITERLAASIYKQGEQARSQGRLREAVGHFERVATAAARSSVRPTAQYDAAAALIALKDWDGAERVLEDFRQRYPGHPLQEELGSKLAVVYTEKGQWALAAREFERLAAAKKDPQLSREALWQAAELYEKAGSKGPAARVYERYVQQNAQPLEAAVEARFRLSRIAREQGNATLELSWLKAVEKADLAGGDARTDRTRYLGASAALALAEPTDQSYRAVALVEPLKAQLKLKKARMEDVLKAFGVAADYGVADIATAATYRIAEVYRDFGHALLNSQRPKGLSKDEREQYDVLLEEQAFPFEEKAIELHELNARRTSQGIYDQWVRSSYVALAELRPVRYGKTEHSEVAIDAIR